LRALDDRTAYRVQGYHFSPAYKARVWDGKEHLVKAIKGPGEWHRAPVGLLGEVLAMASAMDLEFVIEDHRRQAALGSVSTRWNHVDFQIRPYQEEAVEAVMADRGLETGKGLIDVATRGGKTVIVFYLAHRLGVPTLILVQSERVMKQTIILGRKCLNTKIGRVGAGVWDPREITVASCQTLTHKSNADRARALVQDFDLVNFDEAHHLQGKSWRALLEEVDAPYKVGTSASIFLHRRKETPKGTIWIRAACGPVLYRITPSELIEQGYLVPPRIELVRVTGPKIKADTWDEVYDRGIVFHEARNGKVVRKAHEYRERGLTVLVNARLLDHVDVLEERLKDAGLSLEVVIGETLARDRDRRILRFVNRGVDVLLGTVFKEGVDIPAIEGVVNAAGGKSKIAAVQQFRNLTPADGKSTAVLADFMDLHHPTLAKHALARVKVYRSHAMFETEVTE
jgi:superfamily II DNA or RNA helicase